MSNQDTNARPRPAMPPICMSRRSKRSTIVSTRLMRRSFRTPLSSWRAKPRMLLRMRSIGARVFSKSAPKCF